MSKLEIGEKFRFPKFEIHKFFKVSIDEDKLNGFLSFMLILLVLLAILNFRGDKDLNYISVCVAIVVGFSSILTFLVNISVSMRLKFYEDYPFLNKVEYNEIKNFVSLNFVKGALNVKECMVFKIDENDPEIHELVENNLFFEDKKLIISNFNLKKDKLALLLDFVGEMKAIIEVEYNLEDTFNISYKYTNFEIGWFKYLKNSKINLSMIMTILEIFIFNMAFTSF